MNGRTRQQYSLAENILHVRAASAELLAEFDLAYGDLRMETGRPADFELDLVEGRLPDPPAHLPLAFDGDMPGEGHCRLHVSDEETFLLFPGRCAVWIDRRSRSGRISVAPGGGDAIRGAAGVVAIETAADEVGQIMMHAAALTLPGERNCILIHGPSGAGKTTTSLALVASGFGFCSDDAVFLCARQSGFAVWGFPSALKVHRNTSALVPSLAPTLAGVWNEEGEQALPRVTLANYGRVEDYQPRPVAALFRLTRCESEKTEIVTIRRTDMLMGLAADNVLVGAAGMPAVQKHRFKALSRLAASVPVFEIRAGRDLGGLGAAVTATLAKQPQPSIVS